MNGLDLAEVARRSRVSASAIRFYEEKGLVASIGRRDARLAASRLERPQFQKMVRLAGAGRLSGCGFSPARS